MEKFETVQKNLEKLGYIVHCFPNIPEANHHLTSVIQNTTVGIGGSKTIEAMGISTLLREKNQVLWAWEGDDTKEATRAQVYLSSANALAETGEIINIDGLGNRVSACIYGTERVFFLISANKIEKTQEKALWRARNIASPKNAQRLNKKTPCAKLADKCYDCNSPDRICRSLVIHLGKPSGSACEVILIDETLGY